MENDNTSAYEKPQITSYSEQELEDSIEAVGNTGVTP